MSRIVPRIGIGALATWLIVLVAIAATGALWATPLHVRFAAYEPVLLVGALVALALWLLTFSCATQRQRALQERSRLQVIRARESIVEALIEIDPPAKVKRSYWPAWVLAVLALGISAAVRFWPNAEHLLSTLDRALLGAGGTVALWLLVWSTLINRSRARQYELQRAASEGSAQLARATLEQMPVMVSICAPDGRRNDFNTRFLQVFGRDERALVGLDWLNYLHKQDREAWETVLQKGAGKKNTPITIEYGITGPNSQNRWVHEVLTPYWLEDGRFIGYLATGFDITRQVENETESVKTIERLREEATSNATAAERLKDDVATLAQEGERLRQDLASESAKLQRMEKKREDAEADANKAKGEAKTLKAEKAEIGAENRRLTRALEKLEKELEKAQADAKRAQEENDQQFEQIERLKRETNEWRQTESQLRTKVSLLTEQLQELESVKEETRAAAERAEEDFSRRQGEVMERAERDARGLADALRPGIGGVRDAILRLQTGAQGDEQMDELETALASVSAINVYVDSVLGTPVERSRTPRKVDVEGRVFDLREAAQSVTDVLERTADMKGVRLKCHVAKDFPTSVCGDSGAIREALMLLGSQTLRLAQSGSVTLGLSHRASVNSLVPSRFEIACDGIGVTADRFRAALALDSSAGEGGAGESRQARAAWEILKSLHGEFGFDAKGDEDYTLWFSVNLTRRARTPEPVETVHTPLRRVPIVDSTEADQIPEEAAPTTAPAVERNMRGETMSSRPASAPRLPQEGTQSNLGPVLELGQSSARIKTTKEIHGAVKLVIKHGSGDIEIPVEAESSTKVAARHYDTVVQFIEVPEEQRKALRNIAMTNRRQTTIAAPIDQES